MSICLCFHVRTNRINLSPNLLEFLGGLQWLGVPKAGQWRHRPTEEERGYWIGPWMPCGTRDLTARTPRDTCLGCGSTFCFTIKGIPRRWGCRRLMPSWPATRLKGWMARLTRIIQARRASEGNRGDSFACASGFNARRFG